MKKILIGLSLLLVGCRASLPKGEWIVEDKVYQYSNFFIADVTMMKDFHHNYGDKYEVIAFNSETNTIVCRKK